MRFFFILTLFYLGFINSYAQLQSQNKVESRVTFKIKNLGMNVNGNFSKIAITSNINTDSLKQSYVSGIIEVNSIDTQNKKRDTHLLRDDFFDASSYKVIKLTSTKIEKSVKNKYMLTANLSIKRTTRRIVIPLEINEDSTSITIKSNFSLNRRDYGIGGRSWILSDNVKIQVVYKANK